MEKIKKISGNDQQYFLDLPKVHFLFEMNDVALAHYEKCTGIKAQLDAFNRPVFQPKTHYQFTKLILVLGEAKFQFHDNASNQNTLFIKSLHNVGFKVDSVCKKCCEENRINTDGLSQKSRLLC